MVSFWVVFAIRFFLVASAVLLIMMVIFFGIVLFHLSLRFVKILSFMIHERGQGSLAQVSCFGMVGFLCFLGLMVLLLGIVRFIWLKLLLVGTLLVWFLSGVSLMILVLMRLLHVCLIPPMFWSDGSMVLDSVTGVSAAGTGMFAHLSEYCWGGRRWGHVDHAQTVGVAHSCRAFVSVPGPLQTVQRAELWVVILALQSDKAVHVGVDNLGVVRHVGRLLDGLLPSVPFELVTDGDLLVLIRRMIDLRGHNTVRVTKFKGHAVRVWFSDGHVRELDRLGNNAADEAADFGRGRVGPGAIDARRSLSGVCGRWYPVLLDLHRFFIAISRRLLVMVSMVVLLLIR